MEISVNKRIKDIADLLFNGNTSAMARATSINQSTLRDIIANKVKPSYDTIKGIVECPLIQLNTDWLITGIGEMLKEEERNMLINYSAPDGTLINYANIGAPYYNVDFMGGFDIILNDQTVNPEYYIDFKPYNKPGVIWCNVSGKSMEPEINNGDFIAIKEATTRIDYLPFGEIYGIVTEDFRTIKRMAKSEKEGHIKLIPTNKGVEFSAQDIPISIIQKIFMVIGSVKRF